MCCPTLRRTAAGLWKETGWIGETVAWPIPWWRLSSSLILSPQRKATRICGVWGVPQWQIGTTNPKVPRITKFSAWHTTRCHCLIRIICTSACHLNSPWLIMAPWLGLFSRNEMRHAPQHALCCCRALLLSGASAAPAPQDLGVTVNFITCLQSKHIETMSSYFTYWLTSPNFW